VRGHILICFLAYTIQKVVEKKLRGTGIKLTGEKVLSLFKQMGIAVMEVGKGSCAYTSEPTYIQRMILKALKIQSPPRVIMETK